MRKELSPDEKFMKEALRQARKAYKLEEAPIGCVIVYDGKVIARGYNRRNIDKSTLSLMLARGVDMIKIVLLSEKYPQHSI